MCRFHSSVLRLVLACLVSQIGFAAPPDQVPPPLEAAVAELTAPLRAWKVQRVDQEPSVVIDGQRGYRVVLRMTWKEPPPGAVPQQVPSPRAGDDPTWIARHSDWHFVLFPAGDAAPGPEAKRDILWHIPDEKHFRLPVAMGEGHGFVWFSYSTIPMQHFLRERLKLTGGDDRLQLALRGLSVDDEGTSTRNSVLPLFVQFGDAGFDALDKVIPISNDPSPAIRALAYFRDDRATARLVELYQYPNPDMHRAAAYALIHQPYRPAAKPAYLDMLDRQLHVTEAMRAALEFRWEEALPLIERVVEKPSSLGAYREAYTTWRQLSGRPIDEKLFEAAKVIHGQSGRDPALHPTEDELAAAKRTIIESGDVEGSAFVAFTLATFVTKGNTAPVNKAGVQILRALPRPVVEKMLTRLRNGLGDSDRQTVEKVLRQVM